MANGEFGGGDGTLAYPYLVEDAEDLDAMRDSLSSHYLQTSDIDLSSWGNWIPIGGSGSNSASGVGATFSGSYDGSGYQIKNMTCEHPSKNYVGLFGGTSTESLIRVSVVDFVVKGGTNVGAVAGNAQGELVDCNSSGLVKGVNNVGGITGYLFGAGSTGCNSSGVVEGSISVGGIAGNSLGGSTLISDCHSTCDVIGFDSSVGGIVGSGSGPVSNCYSTGDISGPKLTGGIVGSGSGPVSNCYSTGDISGSSLTGGIVGDFSTLIANCYSTGEVTGTDYVGGIHGGVAGYSSSTMVVENSYSTGDISGESYIGGIVGRGGPCTNCYSSGIVLGSNYVAGISGSHNPNAKAQNTGCYSLNPVIYRLPGSASLNFGDIIGSAVNNNSRPSNCYSLDTLEFRQL